MFTNYKLLLRVFLESNSVLILLQSKIFLLPIRSKTNNKNQNVNSVKCFENLMITGKSNSQFI